MTDSRERAHFETPRPGPNAQEKKRSWPHHLVRCSYFSSLWAWSRHQEFFWGPSDPSISVALHSGGPMKPPGAPEVPMDARKRKGLIATKVRGEKMRGPGARCVVQIFEKRPQSKSVRSPKIPAKYDPGPSDNFDRHGFEQKNLWGRLGASRLALIFPPWAPLGSGLQGELENSSFESSSSPSLRRGRRSRRWNASRVGPESNFIRNISGYEPYIEPEQVIWHRGGSGGHQKGKGMS